MSEDQVNERQSDGTAEREPEFKQEADRRLPCTECCASSIQTGGQSEAGDEVDKGRTDPEGLPKYPDLDDPRDVVFVGHMTRLALGYDSIQDGATMTGIPEEKLPVVIDLWRQLGGIENPRDALRQLRSGISQRPLVSPL